MAETKVRPDGSRSVTCTPVASDGPLLVNVTVKVMVSPTLGVWLLTVLVTARSAWGVSVSVSVALLLPGLGSFTPAGGVTVAVLVSEPVAVGSMVAVKWKVTVAPTGRSTVVARAPLPPLGPVTLPPPVSPVNVQLAAVTPAGRGSDSAAPVAALGPALLTSMV